MNSWFIGLPFLLLLAVGLGIGVYYFSVWIPRTLIDDMDFKIGRDHAGYKMFLYWKNWLLVYLILTGFIFSMGWVVATGFMFIITFRMVDLDPKPIFILSFIMMFVAIILIIWLRIAVYVQGNKKNN